MSTLPRVFFVNRFYAPELPATAQLLSDLAESLASPDRSTHVLTSAPHHYAGRSSEVSHGVTVRRVCAPRLRGNNVFSRAFDWIAFSLAAVWRIWRDLRPGDTLILLSDPPLLAILATPVARWRRANVIHYVQDVYPEIVETLNQRRGFGLWRALRNRAWRAASACVAISTEMARLMAEQGVKPERIRVISNWAPKGLVPASPSAIASLRARWGVADRYVVSYSGNLGRVHDLVPILEVAASLQATRKLIFLFIGEGAQRSSLEEAVRRRALTNVRFLPSQPRLELAISLGAADAHLVTLRAGCEALVFPSKIYGIAAVGRPVVFIGPLGCDLARQIETGGIGRAFSRHDITGISGCLRQWMHEPSTLATLSKSAASFSASTGGLLRAVTQWRQLLNSPEDRSANA